MNSIDEIELGNDAVTSLRMKPDQDESDFDADESSDFKYTIEAMYPERETTSKFSLNNPNARFSVR